MPSFDDKYRFFVEKSSQKRRPPKAQTPFLEIMTQRVEINHKLCHFDPFTVRL